MDEPTLWYGATVTTHDFKEKYYFVAPYIDEESRGDAYDVEARNVSEPFEARNKQEALMKYGNILGEMGERTFTREESQVYSESFRKLSVKTRKNLFDDEENL